MKHLFLLDYFSWSLFLIHVIDMCDRWCELWVLTHAYQAVHFRRPNLIRRPIDLYQADIAHVKELSWY